ncbi:MAG: hypothetical protein II039_00240, partial [Treponema sp.]|nr:hypothetical protein [Treponema sp.]
IVRIENRQGKGHCWKKYKCKQESTSIPGRNRVKKAERGYKVSDSLRGLKLRCRVRTAQMLFCRVSCLHSSAFFTYFCITIVENMHLTSIPIGKT